MKHLKHYRVENSKGISPFGGLTCITERTPGGFRVGVAICSEKDNFSKKIGRNLASYRFKHEYITISDRRIIDFLLNESPHIVHQVTAFLAAKTFKRDRQVLNKVT